MVLPNVSEKGVASLSSIPLHVGTVLHLQSVCLAVPTVLVEEIFLERTRIGNLNFLEVKDYNCVFKFFLFVCVKVFKLQKEL